MVELLILVGGVDHVYNNYESSGHFFYFPGPRTLALFLRKIHTK